jgi:hypothetical protein
VPAIFNDLKSLASDSLAANETKSKYKKAIEEANAYKCDCCKHRGNIEAYPPFHEKEMDADAFIMLKDSKTLLGEEFLCYHTRARAPESTLGIGISISRLPRTGEIRSVNPTMDLLSLKAFTKHKLRRAIDNTPFTHWLPLYFGEKAPIEVITPTFDEDLDEVVDVKRVIEPFDRFTHLLKHSIGFITTGSTKKALTPEKVIEVMPKLIITHLVAMADEKHHHSIVAIRRLFNFFRLYRLLIEMEPKSMEIMEEQLHSFIGSPDKRVKDHCSALGDLLSFVTVSKRFSFTDLRDAYLEEQLDR